MKKIKIFRKKLTENKQKNEYIKNYSENINPN